MKITYFALLVCSATLVPTAIGSGVDDCRAVTLDFDKHPDGTPLKRGDYLSKEWYKEYGLTLSSTGGLGTKPRIFDTSKPGTNKYGDRDLGSPNERCTNPGPGHGEGGEPGEHGENCVPQGNAIIIQEDNDHADEIPDDNVDGGTITFKFKRPVQVSHIGLLDIDYKSFIRIYKSEQGSEDVAVPILGDNSAQTVTIIKQGVHQLDLKLGRSGAITFLSFCYYPEDGRDEKLGINEPCQEDSECESDHCWTDWFIEPPPPALCRCNYETNEGCPDGEDCLSPLPPGSAPACFVPVGASCSGDTDCFSGSCFEDKCAACDEATNYPCETSGEWCAYDYDSAGYICMAPGDGSIGSQCFDDSDCDAGACFLGAGSPPRTCECNTSTNAGCEGDFVCADLGLARGVLDGPPMCKLPVGATCDPEHSNNCSTANCDEVTTLCTCNDYTGYPCDTASGEECLVGAGGTYGCIEIGDGSLESACVEDADCDTDLCYFGYIQPGSPGDCHCNPLTDAGCDGEYECASESEIFEARRVRHSPHTCFLPVGAICDHTKPDTCLTGNCDEGVCTCNVDTHYPCMDNERCLLDLTGRFVCIEIGDGSLGGTCESGNDCDSDHCFISQPGYPGTCACNLTTGEGCDIGAICTASGIPGALPACLWEIGAACNTNEDCITGQCDFSEYPTDYPGTCSCNEDTNEGCSGDFVCADIFQAQGVSGVLADCFLPVGSPCEEAITCLTGVCDSVTNKCSCNSYTDYPCNTKHGEECRVGAGGVYACIKVGDGSILSDCVENSDCDTDLCYFGFIPPGSPGDCSCNPSNDAGCEGDFECAGPDEIVDAQGLFDSLPLCFLPFGSTCDHSDDCLTANCDEVTTLCTCNDYTGYPCDTASGEECLVGAGGAYGCIEIGDGSIGSDCVENSDCDTDLCYFGFIQPGSPGDCSCNPPNDAGCEGDFECADPVELEDARGIFDLVPLCFLPFGATCDPEQSDDCVTTNCDEVTNLCTCNTHTGYPCDTASGEECRVGAEGVYACIKIGDGSIGSDCVENSDCDTDLCYFGFIPPGSPGTCSCNPSNDAGCAGDFECADPVELADAQALFDSFPDCYLPFGATCDYEKADECITGFCDLQFSICACSLDTNYPCDTAGGEICLYNDGRYDCGFGPDPCPEPDPIVICPAVALRVNCQGCEYLNQCQAMSADHYFNQATCYQI